MLSPDFISALSALAGTFVGGFTSIITSWLGQRHQSKVERRMRDKSEREELYKQFILEASSLYVDALEHEQTDVPKFINIYATLNLIRILSSQKVIEAADRALRQIIGTYPKKKKTLHELVTSTDNEAFDLLRPFSQACRDELK